MKRRTWGLLLVVLLLVSLILSPTGRAVAEEEAEPTNEPESAAVRMKGETILGETLNLPDSDTLFARYVNERLKLKPRGQMFANGIGAGERLSGSTAIAYNKISLLIPQVADGILSSTQFTIPATELSFEQICWTAAELGLETVYDENNDISKDAYWAVYSKIEPQIDLGLLLSALLADNPYNLYWYDKTRGTGYDFDVFSEGETLTLNNLYFFFPVLAEYAGEEDYTVDPSVAQTVQVVKANAQTIVTEYSAKSDYEKLDGYRREICALVSYNFDALDQLNAGTITNGNPWQLIWVFDDDPSTNVVCEGYAKAFQYLCDLTTFNSNQIRCITVSGTMSGGTGAGAHMWNVVRMDDGNNYLVDITNCDEGSIGASKALFLATPVSGSVEEGYSFNANGESIAYTYSDSTLRAFGSDDLLINGSGDAPADRFLEIDEATFPDPVFRQWIIDNLDVSGSEADGFYMTRPQVDAVTSISAPGMGIQTLKGIEWFTNLLSLDLGPLYIFEGESAGSYYNCLTSLDVSKNTALKELDCRCNRLTQLDVSNNLSLSELWCIGNQLTALDVSHNTSLIKLYCGENQLTSLDVSKNTALEVLDCSWNQLSTLDVSNNLALVQLDCPRCGLSSIDVSHNTNLVQLGLPENCLETIDVSHNVHLKKMYCRRNNLTSLDVSKNTELCFLECYENQLTALDVSNNAALEELDCHDNRIASLDLSRNTKLNSDQINLNGQQLFAQTLAKTSEGYVFDLGALVIDPTKATIATEEGTYDSTIGIVTFVDPTDSFVYEYDTDCGRMNVTVELTYSAPHVTCIAITTLPDMIGYPEGTAFSAIGGKLTLTYDDGTTEDIDLTLDMISGYDPSVAGVQTLTVTYEGKTTTFDITVNHVPGEPVQENEVPATAEAEGSYDEVVYCMICGKELSREHRAIEKLSGTFTGIVTYRSGNEVYLQKGANGILALLDGENDAASMAAVKPGKQVTVTGEATTYKQSGYHIPEMLNAMIASVADTDEQITPVSVTISELNDARMAQLVKVEATAEKLKDAQLQLALDEYTPERPLTITGVLSANLHGRILLGATIEAKPHTPDNIVRENETPATCTENGHYDEVVYCSVCHEELSRETKVIPAVGHTPGEPVREDEVPATKETAGSYDEVIYCAICGEELSRETKVLTKTVKGMTLTQEPEDATVRNGQKAKFTVKTIGKPKTIQWYYRTSPTAKWKKVSRNGTKMTLTVTGKPTNNGYQYRCMLKNSHGTLYSDPATLTVELFPPKIITEPQTVTVDSGDVAEFTVEAQGDGLTYQWYYCKPLTTTWSKVKNNGTSATLTVTGKPSNNGYQYHCVIKNKDGKVTTQDVTLDVTLFPPEIKVQPQNATVKIGEAAEFTLMVEGKNVTYQWYYRKTTTGSWTKVKNNGTGATLTVTGKIANDGYQYQCEAKNTDGSVTSNEVTLDVDYHLPEITQQPTGVKAKKGETVTFTVEAKDPYEAGLTYQWYYRKSSSGKWTKVKGATEPVYTFTATTKKNGYQYKCDVSNADGKVSSKTVTLKVK